MAKKETKPKEKPIKKPPVTPEPPSPQPQGPTDPPTNPPGQPPQKVKPTKWVLLWIFAALLSLELYSLVPYSEEKKAFFRFSTQKLTLQAWIDYAATRFGILVLLYLLQRNIPKYEQQLRIAFWLFLGYIVDYFLRYNLPIEGTRLSYTLFMLIALGAIFVLTILSERKSL